MKQYPYMYSLRKQKDLFFNFKAFHRTIAWKTLSKCLSFIKHLATGGFVFSYISVEKKLKCRIKIYLREFKTICFTEICLDGPLLKLFQPGHFVKIL